MKQRTTAKQRPQVCSGVIALCPSYALDIRTKVSTLGVIIKYRPLIIEYLLLVIARRVDFDETVFRRISYGNSLRNRVFVGLKTVLKDSKI